MNAFISALPGVFEAIEASDEVREAFVFAAWRHVAGAQVAERTSPISVEGRQLIVAVADKTWKRNLESLASQLLFKVNAVLALDTVDFIEFRIAPDRISAGDLIDDLPADDPASLPYELSTSLRTIRDGELRQTVATTAMACLSRTEALSYLDPETVN